MHTTLSIAGSVIVATSTHSLNFVNQYLGLLEEDVNPVQKCPVVSLDGRVALTVREKTKESCHYVLDPHGLAVSFTAAVAAAHKGLNAGQLPFAAVLLDCMLPPTES